MAGFEHDPHSERGYNCPRNFLGFTSYAALRPFEAAYAIKRGGELEDRVVRERFDSTHLQGIHRYLFQDIFPWAGEFRHVDIMKGNSTFALAIHIEAALEEALTKLRRENFLKGFSAELFAKRAAFYLGEINAIHPFREGNGRTQREFIRQLAMNAGLALSWAGFTQHENTSASILSHQHGDNSGLATIIERAIAQASA